MSAYSQIPLRRFDRESLIDELIKMSPNLEEHVTFLEQLKRSAEGLATSRGGSWYNERHEISAFTEFIRAMQWFIWNLQRPAGLRDWDVPKLKRYAEHMVSSGALPKKALDIFD
jgi:hypothetical protein